MDASSTDLEHVEGLIKEHHDAKPVFKPKQLAQPTTIPYERIQRTITILQRSFRMRQSERSSEKENTPSNDSAVQSYLAYEHAKRQEELNMQNLIR